MFQKIFKELRRWWARYGLGGSAPVPRTIYTMVAIAEKGEDVFRSILELCDANGIAYFVGGGSWAAKRLNLNHGDLDRFCSALANAFCSSKSVYFRTKDRTTPRPLSGLRDEWTENSRAKHFDILVVEAAAHGDSPQMFMSRIEVDCWFPVAFFTGERRMSSDRANRQIFRPREKTIEHFLSQRLDLDVVGGRALGWPEFPIDVVYTWVDGSDPDWRRSKEAYADSGAGDRLPTKRADHPERFRSRDELRYSLRSLELFAPFVRRVFIVTAGQVPEWLRTDHPRVTMISHDQIYADPTVLPTFNSHSIEARLHHIEGLAEHFLYFNDDFMLGALCSPEDFFHANGIIKFFAGDARVYHCDIDETSEEYIVADRNANELFLKDFGAAGREIMAHVPYPCRRSLLAEIEERYAPAVERTVAHRFRSATDVRLLPFMQYHYGHYTGKAVPGMISSKYIALWRPNLEQTLATVLARRSWKAFCLNDSGVSEEAERTVDRLVDDFLQRYYPMKSSFEV